MADEEIRTDEPEVEGHLTKPEPSDVAKPRAEDEPEVEGHLVKPQSENLKPNLKPNVKP